MSKTRYFQCPVSPTHLCGIGTVYCEFCGMNIITGRFSIKRPYKLPIKYGKDHKHDSKF